MSISIIHSAKLRGLRGTHSVCFDTTKGTTVLDQRRYSVPDGDASRMAICCVHIAVGLPSPW